MEYFNIKEADLTNLGAIHTASEIWNQPQVWASTFKKFTREEAEIIRFRNEVLKKAKKIILTGAGTSAYIGYSLEGTFQRFTGITTVSIPTTHLVTHPKDYLDENMPTLVISFARSGNSPESVAAVKLIDRICKSVSHLVITCDNQGQLAQYQSPNPKFTFVLPPESNDKSLAMTSSYTSMLLTGLLFARIEQNGELHKQVDRLVEFGKGIIQKQGETLKEIASLDFKRAVFLGSGPLFGTSTESSLKLQELTDGAIICKNESYLGFRHGPKAVIDEGTIVVFLFSGIASVQRYEKDLVRDMQRGKKAMRLIGVSEAPVTDLALDTTICCCDSTASIDEDFLSICAVLPAQMLGLFKSMELGLKPDNPSVSGAISRVVEGVIIYDEEVI
ncbi:MAG: SIS domain-containing protein [Bacteroides sp.]|nr:SIS domain-containing protein [Bacteroides sp.]